jgi:hypothetical protein
LHTNEGLVSVPLYRVLVNRGLAKPSQRRSLQDFNVTTVLAGNGPKVLCPGVSGSVGSLSHKLAKAISFFVACEAGKGWELCKAYRTPDATFAAQAEPLGDVKSLQQHCDWMKGLLGFIPDGVTRSCAATDEQRPNVSAYAVFPCAHTGHGGVQFHRRARRWRRTTCTLCSSTGDKIRHMTKVWHAGFAVKALGWT